MSKHCRAFFSNRTEHLFLHLKETLFAAPSTPFSRRLIIVPSPAMKSWLMTQMAQDPDLGIAAGFEITHLDQAIKLLLSSLFPEPLHSSLNPTSSMELALAIEGEIRSIIAAQADASQSEQEIWKPLLDYLKVTTGKLSKKTEKRLITLSESLAGLFLQYGKYGRTTIPKWESNLPPEWQQRLWCRIFCTETQTPWNYPIREIESTMGSQPLSCDIQIHIFAMSFLPQLDHNFFMHIAQAIPVHYYLLSPCQAFWSDILSDRESRSVQSLWKKRGVSQSQQEALEEFLRDRNPLLANLGKLGREMARQIENSDLIADETYVIAENACTHSQYQELLHDELVIEERQHSLSLLEAVQTDMLLLRNPEAAEKIPFENLDRSIQVHAACNRLREMQVLHDVLLGIIERHANDAEPICPGDIMVMIPNIEAYIPYIKTVFENPDSALEAQIMDLPLSAMSPLIQGFLHLISLSHGRWDASSIKQLLSYPHFQKRHAFTAEEANKLQEWIEDTEVRWGLSSMHRNELLARDRGGRAMIDNSPAGTWEYAIEKLLNGLIIAPVDDGKDQIKVESSQSGLLGKWIQIIRSLHSDLAWLREGVHLSLKEWSSYLRSLCDAYFLSDDPAADARETLLMHIDTFGNIGGRIPQALYPFATVKHHLETILSRSTRCYREHVLHAVRFCSMLPMRAIPAKVIALAGMQDDSFPRKERHLSLNLLKKDSETDYCPSSTDYDRFLFLESLLSARRYFIMTYHQGSSGGSNEQLPSLAVTELLSYLDRAYTTKEGKLSEECLHIHPFLPFDRTYFFPGAVFPSYSKQNYSAAKAYYNPEKSTPTSFIHSFTVEEPSGLFNTAKNEHTINLRELAAFAKNPIKAYLNKSLGIYLERAEDRQEKNDEDFHLNSLKSHLLKQSALLKPAEHIWERASKDGRLPLGAFKSVAEKSFKQEIAGFNENLRIQGVDRIFKLICSEASTTLTLSSEGHWLIPPLVIKQNDQTIKIVGELEHISTAGMITTINDGKGDIAKIWPQFLFLSCLIKTHSLPIASRIIFAKGQKGERNSFSDHPHSILEGYLEYYLASLEHPSPLLPKWIPPVIEGKSASLEKEMGLMINEGFHVQYDEYVKWAMRGVALPNSEELIVKWQPKARQLFGDVFKIWYERHS